MNKILVIGDSCEDVFTYGHCKRLSPEAPVPVLNPISTKTNYGMATNVFNNIVALDGIGDIPTISCDLYTNKDKPIKTRYIEKESNQTLLRVDEHDEIQFIDVDILMKTRFMEYDAVVISDYNKGYLSEDMIALVSNRHPLVFMDSKKKLDSWCKNVSVIKINEKEYFENSDWLENYRGKLIITLGSRGTKFEDVIYPIQEQHPVRDLTGAGDTYLAALVVEYLRTEDIRKSIQFANKCAAWVVTQKGVTVVDLNKMK